MAEVYSLNEFLVANTWCYGDIKSFLERDHSSINEQDNLRRSPLFYVLKSTKCSKEIVRLLLEYGASIDSRDWRGDTPLLFALQYCRDETAIIELIEKGADVKVQDEFGNSSLCLAFDYRPSKNIIENILKAGCSLQSCTHHETVWHCFTAFCKRMFESGFSEDIMKLIIEAGADVATVDSDGRSPLCLVLFKGAGVGDIKLLLSKGASFNDCKEHNSPMLCVTRGYSGTLLKANVVDLLLNKGASVEQVNEQTRMPLQLALCYCLYETDAIRILLNLARMDMDLKNIKHEIFGNLLHFAAANPYGKASIVKFLLDNGVCSYEINAQGRTPLHEAMRSDRRELRTIELLVKSGSPVNLKCKDGYTPLSFAVERQMPGCVFEVLLAAGAIIDGLTDRFGVSLLEQTLNMWKCLGIDRCKILLKWLLIENPEFQIKGLVEVHEVNAEFSNFAEKCVFDLQRMKSVNIGRYLTLSEFIKTDSPQNAVCDCEPKLNFDQLLQAISNIPILNFFDVISSKFSKLLLMEKLQQLSVYTVIHCLDYPFIDHKIVCKYDCLRKIAKYLRKPDLLCLILAFYFTSDYVRNDTMLIRKKT